MEAILSASFWLGARLPWASLTRLIILERLVSEPTFSALNVKLPIWLTVPEKTLLPAFFSTGTLSPVRELSSIKDSPSRTVPSTAILSPGLTITVSPAITSSMLISATFPSFWIETVLGWSPASFFIAEEVENFALSSRSLPRRMKAVITQTDSK